MILFVLGVWTFLRILCVDAANVSLENVALRQQLAVLQRSVPRPKVCRRDPLFLVCPLRLLTGWRSRFVVVPPPPFLSWHRQGLSLYLRLKFPTPPPPRPR